MYNSFLEYVIQCGTLKRGLCFIFNIINCIHYTKMGRKTAQNVTQTTTLDYYFKFRSHF